MPLEQRPQERPGPPSANREKDLVRSAQVWAGFLDDAAEPLEGLALRFQHGTHPLVERKASKVKAPGDPHALEAAIEGLTKPGRVGRIAGRVAGIGPGH